MTIYLWSGQPGTAIAVVSRTEQAIVLNAFQQFGPGDMSWVAAIADLASEGESAIVVEAAEANTIRRILLQGNGNLSIRIRTPPLLTSAEASLAIFQADLKIRHRSVWDELIASARRNGEIDLCEMALALACKDQRSQPMEVRRDDRRRAKPEDLFVDN